MTPKCNLIAEVNGHVTCEKSLVGCIRACIHRKDGEAFKMLLRTRPPIYERQEDTGEGVWKRNRE